MVEIEKFPWGNEWSASEGAGNYAGSESGKRFSGGGRWEAYEHDDGAARTARVGGYRVNRFGFYDLGGNVMECLSSVVYLLICWIAFWQPLCRKRLAIRLRTVAFPMASVSG